MFIVIFALFNSLLLSHFNTSILIFLLLLFIILFLGVILLTYLTRITVGIISRWPKLSHSAAEGADDTVGSGPGLTARVLIFVMLMPAITVGTTTEHAALPVSQ